MIKYFSISNFPRADQTLEMMLKQSAGSQLTRDSLYVNYGEIPSPCRCKSPFTWVRNRPDVSMKFEIVN